MSEPPHGLAGPQDPGQRDSTAEPPAHGPVPYPPPPATFAPPPPYTSPPPTYTPPATYAPTPGYAAPPPPAGYSPPPPAGYAQPQPVRPTNTLAIVALVLAFVVPVGGVICGHMARKQIKETGEDGSGMATAALIIGYVYTALAVLALCAAAAIVLATRNT